MALFEQKAPPIMAGLMRDLAVTLNQAAGILGNIGEECGGFEQLTQTGGGGGRGWIQWDGPRREAFFAWCSTHGLQWISDEANYRYLVLETLTTEKAALAALKATSTVKDATDIFEAKDERAGVPALSVRELYANRALAAYNLAPKPVAPISFSTVTVPVTPPATQGTQQVNAASIKGLLGLLMGFAGIAMPFVPTMYQPLVMALIGLFGGGHALTSAAMQSK